MCSRRKSLLAVPCRIMAFCAFFCTVALSAGKAGDSLPVGAILPYASPNAPDGFFSCDGRLLNRTDNPELFAVIGTTYGPARDDAGNPLLTQEEARQFPDPASWIFLFRLPDLQGRYLEGMGRGAVGDLGGEAAHELTEDEMPVHKHGYHDIWFSEHASFSTHPQIAVPGNIGSGRTDGDNVGHQLERDDMDETGGGRPHNNLPPYLIINYIIKH